jgi:hypothetical protein
MIQDANKKNVSRYHRSRVLDSLAGPSFVHQTQDLASGYVA